MGKKSFIILLILSIAILSFCTATFATSKPQFEAITPNKGTNDQTVNVQIDGEFFTKSLTVKLVRAGQPDIIGTNVNLITKEPDDHAVCTFDLHGVATGAWDIVLTNTGTFTKKLKTTIIKSGFTVLNAAPTVTFVDPAEGENNDTYTLDITGTQFRKGAAVKLVKAGENDIVAQNVNVKSSTSITCDTDLSNAKLGKYDVVVVNDDNQVATLKDAFAITQAPAEEPAVDDNQGTEAVDDQSTEAVDDNQATDEDQSVDADQPAEDETPDPNSLLKPIFFDYDQYAIRQDQIDQLDKDIAVLKDNESMVVVLGGHADERGTAQYNIQLSALRAEAVKNYLIGQGVDPSQITTYAYGKDHPAKNGHDESAWSFNRRVDISLWDSAPGKDDALVEEVNQ